MTSNAGRLAAAVLSLLAVTGAATTGRAAAADRTAAAGAVFAMSNVTADNRIVSFRRAADGSLTRVGSISTRGNGIGTDLDTQGPLRLSADHRFLYATNAGSDSISVFAVNGTGLTFLQKVYAGDEPNSITIHKNLLYVLDGSVAGNGIRGFRIGGDGKLTEIANSFRGLSSDIAVPGTVQFSPDGDVLLVTHKTANALLDVKNIIDAFTVGGDGRATGPRPNESNGPRPFSLAFRSDGKVFVAESFNARPGRSALSSYRVSDKGRLSVISGSVKNRQTDSCWVVVTKDGTRAFTANFGTSTISSFALSPAGQASLIDGAAASFDEGSQPVDLALNEDSRFLYLLLRGKGAVAAFRIEGDGSLAPLGIVGGGGLPVNDGASGLAAY